MNINAIYRHPAELEAEAMLSREQPYPEDFTLAERTAERMARARNGLVHVMTDLSPYLDVEKQSLCIAGWIKSWRLSIWPELMRRSGYERYAAY